MEMKYDVLDGDGTWLLTTNLPTLQRLLALHKSAMERVIRETSTGAACTLHSSHRLYFAKWPSVIVQETR